jgi:hypothetical protein
LIPRGEQLNVIRTLVALEKKKIVDEAEQNGW